MGELEKTLHNANVAIVKQKGLEPLINLKYLLVDKTGTLSKNQMTLSNIWCGGNSIKILNDNGSQDHTKLDLKSKAMKLLHENAIVPSEADFGEELGSKPLSEVSVTGNV